MIIKKKKSTKEKSTLHPRNKHGDRYDFKLLIESCPELAPFVTLNAYHNLSIDFFNPQAVKMLNKALLKQYYDIDHWDIPNNYLCPPIPGRGDYIHYVADLLSFYNNGIVPVGHNIKCLDIGVGANCVYPIIGNKEYGWSFVGADIDPIAIKSAKAIIAANATLKNIEIRLQANPKNIFQDIIQKNEHIDISICNPPFHVSAAEARAGAVRKLTNLTRKKIIKPVLNFGGQNNELWCEGGEKKFICDMIRQSKQFATSCFLFSTLVAKQVHLKIIYAELKKVCAIDVKTILMGQGNKTSRIVAWTFLSEEERKEWIEENW